MSAVRKSASPSSRSSEVPSSIFRSIARRAGSAVLTGSVPPGRSAGAWVGQRPARHVLVSVRNAGKGHKDVGRVSLRSSCTSQKPSCTRGSRRPPRERTRLVTSTTPTELEAATALDPPARSFAVDVWRRFSRAPGAVVGAVVIGTIVLLALFAPLVASSDPLGQNIAYGPHAPSAAHWFGTDKLGRDVFSRIVYGARISIRIGFVAVGFAISAGTLIGLVAGYAGGRTESALMALMDLMLAFPSIILAIGITTILGPSITNLMIAVGIVYVPQYARLARSAARAIGAATPLILARHVLPNILAPLLVQATLGIATAELEAAGLSYLGLGARPPTPVWGAMLNDARDYWISAPWALIFPGVAIPVLVLGFNLLGDGLRDALDPKQR